MRASLLLSLLVLLLAGCAGWSENTLARFERVPAQGNFYARPKAAVFTALQEVLTTQGYTVTKSEPAQGILEAHGALLETAQRGQSRQFLIAARVRAVGDNETGVELLVSRAEEGTFKAGATNEALREHGRYESIFEALEASLGPDSWLPSTEPGR